MDRPPCAFALKLDETDAAMIVALLDAGYSQRRIGARFCITHQMVGRINLGRSWWWASGRPQLITPRGGSETPAAKRARRLKKGT